VRFNTRTFSGFIAAAGAAIAMTACGSSSSSPTSPSTGGGGSSSPGASGATITIGSNGAVSPAQVSISVGKSVTVVNNDSRPHEIASNPHPAHTDCPSTNALGTLSPGQTKLTNAYTVARSCGFHDHLNPENSALQGTIVIQ
jgi:plastocyanin